VQIKRPRDDVEFPWMKEIVECKIFYSACLACGHIDLRVLGLVQATLKRVVCGDQSCDLALIRTTRLTAFYPAM
jgi:hypothetical protein